MRYSARRGRGIVTAFIVIAWALIGYTFGWVTFAAITELTGVSDMEGRGAVPALLLAGPLGLAAGIPLGVSLWRKFQSDTRKRRWFAALSFTGIFAVPLGIYVFETVRTYDWLDSFGKTWALSYEIRMPAGARVPLKDTVVMTLRSRKETPTARIYQNSLLRRDDRLVIRAEFDLRYAQRDRTVALHIGDGPTYLFKARIAARPETVGYSGNEDGWVPVDEVEDKAGDKPRPPRPDERYEIRYSAR
jgi:hypothetical protein